jgi:ABC-type nickel/cobalt efflux system permease component RcnA
MLGAIAIDRTIYGVVLVAAFSFGLAAVLTSIGLVMVYGRHLLAGSRLHTLAGSRLVSQVTGLAPVMSALAILGAGLVLTGRAMF